MLEGEGNGKFFSFLYLRHFFPDNSKFVNPNFDCIYLLMFNGNNGFL